MGDLVFEWDPLKDAANRRVHGVGFRESTSVFADENALFMGDPEHSEEEDRFVLLGLSYQSRLLLVCHCFRESEDTIRIISARKANRSERAEYNRRLRQ